MAVLILGLGSSGLSAAEFLRKRGVRVLGSDRDPKRVEEFQAKGFSGFLESASFDFPDIEYVVASPGVSPKTALYSRARELGIPIIGEAELALRELQQPCVAITGTNGKTTVTLLVTHVLNSSGKRARALGNVGAPLTGHTPSDEIVVAEMSSYQIDTMQTAVFDVGVILNITPDHLDRYGSMQAYAASKCRLEKYMKRGAPLFVSAAVASEFGELFASAPLVIEELELPLCEGKPEYEKQNILAAWAICRHFGISQEMFADAFSTFKKPAHRIEFIKEIDGVYYYDDSKGTNIDAVIQAVKGMTTRVVLIAGGLDKGSSYLPWLPVFEGKVKRIIALGAAAPKIAEELGASFAVERVCSMEEAVQRAAEVSEEGEAVLLSPGCSSYDMFRDYAHRGEEFQRCVHQVQERKKI